ELRMGPVQHARHFVLQRGQLRGRGCRHRVERAVALFVLAVVEVEVAERGGVHARDDRRAQRRATRAVGALAHARPARAYARIVPGSGYVHRPRPNLTFMETAIHRRSDSMKPTVRKHMAAALLLLAPLGAVLVAQPAAAQYAPQYRVAQV